MNKLWTRMALSYVFVFLMAISIPVVITGVLDAIEVINIEEFTFGKREEILHENDSSNFLERFPRGMISILLFSGIIGIGAGALVSRQVAKPIAEMAEAVGRIGKKDFDTHLEVKGTEELRVLAAAFNQMVVHLDDTEKQRQNLLADVSHELRTPLTVLEGQLRGALDNVMELNGEDLANLYNQTHHLIKLVNDLHELTQAEARKMPMEYVSTEIAPLVKEVSDLFKPLANENGVTLSMDIEAGLPPVTIDSYRIRQSLHNLLANSLRYTPSGGLIHLRVFEEKEKIVVEIKDTGEGINSEHLEHLFDRFYRVDSSRTKDTGGTGLGLAIVKAIIESHDGQVSAKSDGIGKGSTFSFTLPIE